MPFAEGLQKNNEGTTMKHLFPALAGKPEGSGQVSSYKAGQVVL